MYATLLVGFGVLVGGLAGVLVTAVLASGARAEAVQEAYSRGRVTGLQEGLDKGYLQAEAVQRQKDSQRAHKAARTRAERKAP